MTVSHWWLLGRRKFCWSQTNDNEAYRLCGQKSFFCGGFMWRLDCLFRSSSRCSYNTIHHHAFLVLEAVDHDFHVNNSMAIELREESNRWTVSLVRINSLEGSIKCLCLAIGENWKALYCHVPMPHGVPGDWRMNKTTFGALVDR